MTIPTQQLVTLMIVGFTLSTLAWILLFVYMIRLLKPNKPAGDRNPPFVFNPQLITSYEAWYTRALHMYMTRYLEEQLGKTYSTLSDLKMDSDFVLDGVVAVGARIAESMPGFYRNYMVQFYGEEQFSDSIYSPVRAAFLELVSKEQKKRIQR